MSRNLVGVALAACCFAAAAAPQIESVVVKPSPAVAAGGKPAEVEVVVSVSRPRTGLQDCEASVDPGDGSRARRLEFGVANTRALRHVYSKNGSYRVAVKGSGSTPCEGARETALTVSGIADSGKKAPATKEAKKTKP